ncbi:MAG TPA: rod shape-determining protein MreC [Acidimicrobiales bacterium]
MALSRRAGRARYRLALLVLTAITLLTLDFRQFGPLERAQSAVRDALSPVRSGVMSVVSPVSDAVSGVFDFGQLQDENERLRAELEELRGQRIADEEAAERLAQLHEELGIPDVGGIPTQVARVSGGPIGNFDEHVIEINKGSSSGVREGMAVINRAGLVGRVVEVDGNRATVQLVSAPDFAVGVRIGGEVALARGTGSTTHLRAAEGLSEENPAHVHDAVVTSGGVSSRVPADIPVGRVDTIDLGSGAPVVTIELSADLGRLDYVTVLLDTPEPG